MTRDGHEPRKHSSVCHVPGLLTMNCHKHLGHKRATLVHKVCGEAGGPLGMLEILNVQGISS